jgi:hypothetical protein
MQRRSGKKRKPAVTHGGMENQNSKNREKTGSLLPRTLLVAVRLQALSALVLVHLQSSFLFQVTHGE